MWHWWHWATLAARWKRGSPERTGHLASDIHHPPSWLAVQDGAFEGSLRVADARSAQQGVAFAGKRLGINHGVLVSQGPRNQVSRTLGAFDRRGFSAPGPGGWKSETQGVGRAGAFPDCGGESFLASSSVWSPPADVALFGEHTSGRCDGSQVAQDLNPGRRVTRDTGAIPAGSTGRLDHRLLPAAHRVPGLQPGTEGRSRLTSGSGHTLLSLSWKL